VIELHDHVGAQVALDLYHRLGREESARAIDVRLELDAVFIDGAEPCERENLKSSRVGKDRAVPAHEFVESAHLADDLVAGAKMQVVRVPENHGSAHLHEVVGIECLHRGESSDRHECRSLHIAVRRDENAGPCGAGGVLDGERKAHVTERKFNRIGPDSP